MSLHTIKPEITSISVYLTENQKKSIAYITSLGFRFRYNKLDQKIEFTSDLSDLWSVLDNYMAENYAGYNDNSFSPTMIEIYEP